MPGEMRERWKVKRIPGVSAGDSTFVITFQLIGFCSELLLQRSDDLKSKLCRLQR